MINIIRNMIKRAYVTLVHPDTKVYSYTQISYLGNTVDAETLYPYGLNASAPLNSAAIVFNIQGDASNRFCICYTPDRRFKSLKEGEVQIGNVLTQASIKFSEDGKIQIFSDADIEIISSAKVKIVSSTDVEINATNIKITGDVDITGDLAVSGSTALGASGAAIARVGDAVVVSGNPGTITSGSSTNTSA